MPDYDWVHREMAKPGVTLQLLWFEYSDKCRDANEIPYQLTQFKKYYRDYVVKSKATMHIHRKPGELMEGNRQFLPIPQISGAFCGSSVETCAGSLRSISGAVVMSHVR